jgi:hypothetical protein
MGLGLRAKLTDELAALRRVTTMYALVPSFHPIRTAEDFDVDLGR